MQPKLVQLTGRSGKCSDVAAQANCFAGIVAKEVDSLAHFQHRVGHGLAGFADAEREQLPAMLLEQVGSSV